MIDTTQNNPALVKKKIAIERGKRIKLARHLVNLTRKDMQEQHGINSNTLHAWEKGTNCLTEPNAQKLFLVFQASGLSLSKEWLLYGEDPRPTLPDNPPTDTQALSDVLNIRGDLKIFQEINYFRHHNLHTITAMIADEALLPLFYTGDYVGGIQVFAKDLKTLVGDFCIITTENEDVLIRKIFQHQQGNVFTIGAINPFAQLKNPDYFDCAIRTAAPITRHWYLGRTHAKN